LAALKRGAARAGSRMRGIRVFAWLGGRLRRGGAAIGASIGAKFQPAYRRLTVLANRNRKMTIALTIGTASGCLAAAAVLQATFDYNSALGAGEHHARVQAAELAAESARTLDRLAALGIGYVNAVDERSAATVMAGETGRVINIAVADANGRLVAAMHGSAMRAKPLPRTLVAEAQRGRAVARYADPAIGASPMTLVFRADRETPARFVVMLLNPTALVPAFTVGSSALLTPDGATLGLTRGWDRPPPAYVLRTRESGPGLRYVEDDTGRRIVALSTVPGWPLATATSVQASEALAGWWASLPFYVFLTLGTVFAGAGFAYVMMRELALPPKKPHRIDPQAVAQAARVREVALVSRLNVAEKRAEEAERAKAEFLAHMSHELRTPLNAIVGFAEIIETGLFGPAGTGKYVEYAGDIAKAGRDLHQRIGEILEIAGIAGERQRLEKAPLDAVAVARGCLDQVRGFAQARDIKLEAQLAPVPLAQGDATAVRRILIVLLSNALRFTQDGGTIHIGSLVEGDNVVIAVRDNDYGTETPKDSVPANRTVAHLHQRGDRERSFGLGLAMAMALARRMGGMLRIAGARNGALVELRLPKVREQAAPPQEPDVTKLSA
jgi:signal transduction histidine kinase